MNKPNVTAKAAGIITNGDHVFMLVEVEPYSDDIWVRGNKLIYHYYTSKDRTVSVDTYRTLQEGAWELVGKASELSEEQMLPMLKTCSHGNHYKNYGQILAPMFYDSPADSFRSMLTRLDLKPENTVVLKENLTNV